MTLYDLISSINLIIRKILFAAKAWINLLKIFDGKLRPFNPSKS